jgi:hypothetical protein
MRNYPTGASSLSLGHLAWASTSARRIPPPSHQGHTTSLDLPPRFEITLPLPRHGIHSRGPCDSSA